MLAGRHLSLAIVFLFKFEHLPHTHVGITVMVHDPEVLRIIIDTPEYKALMKHPQHEYIWEPLNLEQIQHHVRIDLADGGYFNKVIIILPECILAGSDFKSVV